MKPITTLTLLLPLLMTSLANAKTIADVEVAETIQLADNTLQLNGAGVRSKFFMDLYVGSLYLQQPSSDVEAIINAPKAVIRLNITSGMITSDKMSDAIITGFDDATQGHVAPIKQHIDTFMALFNEPIVDGDQFTFETTQGVGVSAYKNNQLQANIQGEDFRQALLNIWLGDSPAQSSLKAAMLGQ
ncbi:chalcone isomerase family protein [Shewanella algidipiscicola]|uniref:Chalcone isomerase n=1 Tax=Shewanella algidipiscicola TaxID=614070 RepID=A0ABQ4PFH3_9GAMM|nr:chalcone isomerase family protein [Shewanella algidipiscicola]GIU46281.1 chalcone isomerase [Shewanella algidipiscicola]